ncbi:3-deoxy-manno-octulosonate cytidylyltransferase [Pelotomaculum sp. FP]|nr:3-deoxy-manno-octulosonate cytidylyltransferase [Pelotomaculum sp. FP]
MIQRVWEQAIQSKIDEVIIATDSREIAVHCGKFQGRVEMTDSTHLSGTCRCTEIAERFSYDFYINIQGDEPFIPVGLLNQVVDWIWSSYADLQVGTVASTRCTKEDWLNPNVVKAVTTADGVALYFSRSPLPYFREGYQPGVVLKHLGLYIYNNISLARYSLLGEGLLERHEKLEQLRWLENGIPVRIMRTSFESFGIDTPEELLEACKKVLLI